MFSLQRESWLRASLIAPMLVLATATILQGFGQMREVQQARPPHLATSLTKAPEGGWSSVEVPLGPSEFISNEVEKVLNYDDVVNREYARGGQRFGVYAAYWGAGKMPTRLVASHTPDRCWTENGWRCLETKFKHRMSVDGMALQSAEWRKFEPPQGGAVTYVMYWHLVEGRVYDYGERLNNVPDPLLWWKDAAQQVLSGSREQYFIRITSPAPFDELSDDPGFRQVLRDLAKLGLQATEAGSEKP